AAPSCTLAAIAAQTGVSSPLITSSATALVPVARRDARRPTLVPAPTRREILIRACELRATTGHRSYNQGARQPGRTAEPSQRPLRTWPQPGSQHAHSQRWWPECSVL